MAASVFSFILFFIPLTIFIPNLADSGLNFPLNILLVAALFIFLFFALLSLPRLRGLNLSVTAKCLLLALLLSLLPLPFTEAQFFAKAAWRAGATGVAVLCYFALLQLPLTAPRNGQRLLIGVLLLVAGQALIGLLQIFLPALSWVPDSGRPYGIFQQVNVYGSFLATGLALTVMLTILPGLRCHTRLRERCRLAGLALLLLILPALLTWAQSRAAWLGAILTTLLLFSCCGHYDRRRSLLAAGLMVCGVLLAAGLLWLGDVGVGIREVEGSNHARWTMLRDTLRMIALHPISGWGYGSFEYAFQHFRVTQIPPTRVTETAEHPHNEILLWWVEGGLCGLAAMLVLLYAGLHLLRRAWRADRQPYNSNGAAAGQATALCLSLLPLVIHTQLEWPFYMSAFHAMLFLLLLAAADRASGETRRWYPARAAVIPGLRAAMLLFSALMVIMAVITWYGQRQISAVELGGFSQTAELQRLSPLERWLNQDRWQYDRHVALLLAFNNDNDPQKLEAFRLWATGYLRFRVDANVSDSLIRVLQFQHRDAEAERYRQMAQRLFPRDQRFQ